MSVYGRPPVEIPFLCSVASQRVIMVSMFSGSQITRPALKIAGSQCTIIVGPNAISTASTLQSSGTSSGPGVYRLVLSQSECSAQGVPGYAMLYHSTATTGVTHVPLYFPLINSYSTVVGGSGATAGEVAREVWANSGRTLAGESFVTIRGLSNYANLPAVTLVSGQTIQGVSNYANISNVTLHAGTHSGATVQGVSRLNSAVTLNADTHSGATVRGIENYANLPTLVDLTASSITSMANAVVDRTIDNTGFGGRTVGSALAALRNKVVVTESTVTVYATDDSTVLWSGTATTGGTPLSAIDPS